jgi:predicted lipoprotein with Yx(FWY)xxD motif
MTPRKAWAVPVLIAAVALTATACSKATGYTSGSGSQAGGAYGTGTQATNSPATNSPAMSGAVQTAALKVERTKAGMVLAGGQGLTLYYYTADKPGSGKSVCTGACAAAWPPLKAPVKAPAGVRMPGPMGMITRPGGAKQVTINGYPVYYYAGDKAPGQITGNGVDGTWHIIKIKVKSGSTATTAPAATATPTATPTTNTGGGGGYGY